MVCVSIYIYTIHTYMMSFMVTILCIYRVYIYNYIYIPSYYYKIVQTFTKQDFEFLVVEKGSVAQQHWHPGEEHISLSQLGQ